LKKKILEKYRIKCSPRSRKEENMYKLVLNFSALALVFNR